MKFFEIEFSENPEDLFSLIEYERGWGMGGDSTLGSRVAMKLVIFANCDPKMIFYFVEKKRFFLASNHNFAKLFSSSMAEVGRRNSVVVLAHSPHPG